MATSLLLHKVGLAADASTASDYTWAYQITSMVKHGAELAGWMLLATGIAAGIKRVRRQQSPRPDRSLQRWNPSPRDLAHGSAARLVAVPTGSKDRWCAGALIRTT